jgi:hypothetical protein
MPLIFSNGKEWLRDIKEQPFQGLVNQIKEDHRVEQLKLF